MGGGWGGENDMKEVSLQTIVGFIISPEEPTFWILSLQFVTGYLYQLKFSPDCSIVIFICLVVLMLF